MLRGEIYYIQNSKYYNTEDSSTDSLSGRPAVIVSHDALNRASPMLEVVFLTTAEKRDLPTHVIVMGKVPSIALCENISTVSKDRVGAFIRKCTDNEMELIDESLRQSIGLENASPEEIKLKKERDLYKDLYEHVLKRITG